VLELQLFRRHQVLPPEYENPATEPVLRLFGMKRRSIKEQ
jgi:hypothetical protein